MRQMHSWFSSDVNLSRLPLLGLYEFSVVNDQPMLRSKSSNDYVDLLKRAFTNSSQVISGLLDSTEYSLTRNLAKKPKFHQHFSFFVFFFYNSYITRSIFLL